MKHKLVFEFINGQKREFDNIDRINYESTQNHDFLQLFYHSDVKNFEHMIEIPMNNILFYQDILLDITKEDIEKRENYVKEMEKKRQHQQSTSIV